MCPHFVIYIHISLHIPCYFQSYHLDASCIQIASALKFTRDNKNYHQSIRDVEHEQQQQQQQEGGEEERPQQQDGERVDQEEATGAVVNTTDDHEHQKKQQLYYEEVVTSKSDLLVEF